MTDWFFTSACLPLSINLLLNRACVCSAKVPWQGCVHLCTSWTPHGNQRVTFPPFLHTMRVLLPQMSCPVWAGSSQALQRLNHDWICFIWVQVVGTAVCLSIFWAKQAKVTDVLIWEHVRTKHWKSRYSECNYWNEDFGNQWLILAALRNLEGT